MAINFLNLRASLEEKTLTPAEKKKREEVAKAIERDNPNMPMGMKMAIATKTAKRVAEETKYYSLVHKATNKVLSTHKDLESAKDEHRGMDQGERAHYRIATSTKEPKTWNIKENNIVAVIDGKRSDRKYNDADHAHNSLSKLVSYQKAKKAELYVNGEKTKHYELNKKYNDFEPKKLDEANEYHKIAAKHLKDMMKKDVTPTQKEYARKMNKRALEAAKMSDPEAAKKHYMGVNEEEELDELNQMTLQRYASKAYRVGMQGGPKSAKHLAGSQRAKEKLKYGDYSEEVEIFERYTEDDIANGGTVIYKHQGKHYMSKVSHKTGGGAGTKIHTTSSLGHVVPLHNVVSTDASDWSRFKNATVKEEVEQIDEMDSKDRFKDYHNETAKLMKGIHTALSQHYNIHNKTAHWGHVGDIRHIHDQLRDIHDRLHEQGEYAKKAKEHSAMRGEEVELSEATQFPSKEHAIKYAKEKVKTHKDSDEGIEVYSMPGGGARVVHTMNSQGRQQVIKGGGKKVTTVTREQVELDEAGPFSYGIKPPKKGSVAYNAMMKRKEQEKGKQPIEPKDQMVGIAKKLTKEEDTHYCAKHVYSELFGEGQVVEGDHAEPNKDGHVEWYNVQFEHGIEKVFTEDIEIMMAEYHANHKRKKRMTNGR